MSIERNESSLAFGSAPRIGEIRRIDRESHPQHPGGKQAKEGGDEERPPAAEAPRDIVEVAAGPPAQTEAVLPPRQEPAAAPIADRHIDIEV
ncbi:MAG TPA: hypothetical protein VKT77_17815 [Chthonomonadaceae bacterium]|nr:hypothetical protein [Chthonomonadaceae bacterium]